MVFSDVKDQVLSRDSDCLYSLKDFTLYRLVCRSRRATLPVPYSDANKNQVSRLLNVEDPTEFDIVWSVDLCSDLVRVRLGRREKKTHPTLE